MAQAGGPPAGRPATDRPHLRRLLRDNWLTGARVSEILGLEAGCIEQHVDEGGVSVAFMRGRIFKLATKRAASCIAGSPSSRSSA